ncbi:DUF3040 domain-containing protein [Lentzea sp. BCCO 10_0798]|uniref:DUF3040 domain-containing protein n=1 Tax=Lentzea kristufekii TaxID=3095430 RepID=A0ABU4TNV7_9PSEU|nr:DUF3040 domain-containing protein [Lentzea sp. BCCO 10_0798]MDX8049975.1 DUF3040 domain-containing protein [Lentzea sp. BCCO 10_0798]
MALPDLTLEHTMLSREEHQRLVDIEDRLRVSDPDLARALSEGPLAQRNLRQRAVAVLAALSFRKRQGSPG